MSAAQAVVRPKRVNHLNLVLPDFDAALAHFTSLFGAPMLADLPAPHFHACLIEIGGVILELFVPAQFLLSARPGPHHLGIEYQVDMDAARAATAAHGLGIVRDIGSAFHTDPTDCHGVAYEFYDGSFHDNDPPVLTTLCKPAAWWRNAHPLGLTGLHGYTQAVSDIEAAARFLQSYLGAALLGEEDRPAIGARCIMLRIADAVVELLAPTGDGSLRRDLERRGQGIRSTVFGVRDIAQAREHFLAHGVALADGSAPGRFAIAPAANLGLVFEFCA